MGRSVRHLYQDNSGAVAATVALSLFALIAAGGIAFDYARLASMDTELQQAADQAALAAASPLDGKANAIIRATAAASNLVVNQTRFANDGGGANVGGLTLTFYDSYNQATDSYGTVTTADASAKVVKVNVGGRTARYALTPIVGALNSGSITAEAVASVGNAICKTPPVMLCNPDEPITNTNTELAFVPTRGVGLRLITGDATIPGNFGWLQAGLANGSNALAAALGYNSPPGDCQPSTDVTTKTGMDASVLNAFNTRFDVYANGNTACPGQYGGTCSPAINTRKDLTCTPTSAGTACSSDNFVWADTNYYHLPVISGSVKEQALPINGSQDPKTMGYPHDYCHAWPIGQQTCAGSKVAGNGAWDRDAYFRVNYNWTNAQWKAATHLTDTGAAKASRFDVYSWELTNQSVANGTKNYGIGVPQVVSNKSVAFGTPANGRPGIAASAAQADRREISVAVLNCYALVKATGKTTAPVTTWMDIFLTEPAIDRTTKGSSKVQYTDQKDIYVEMIKANTAANATAGQVIRRDKPYLIR